ncbi:MAG: sugar nucleotide-binding protein [Alphaproteobacteria bacterium]|nr:sugar nucleotide-binding protein [Alphaproteobacteria bacterium]
MTPCPAMRLLIVGGDSQLGSALAAGARGQGWDVVATSRRDGAALPLDLSQPLEQGPVLSSGVDVAVLCAAVAARKLCAEQPELARRVNVDNTVALARRLAAAGVHVLLLSTSLVFDGLRPRMPANSPRHPIDPYGRFKADAETGFQAVAPTGAILRLTKVIGPQTPLFAQWLDTLRAGQPVTAFSDMTMAPISLDLAVSAMMALVAARPSGIFQVSAESDLSYGEAATYLAGRCGRAGLVRVVSALTCGFLPEHLPPYTSLAMDELTALSGLSAPLPRKALDALLGDGANTIRGM